MELLKRRDIRMLRLIAWHRLTLCQMETVQLPVRGGQHGFQQQLIAVDIARGTRQHGRVNVFSKAAVDLLFRFALFVLEPIFLICPEVIADKGRFSLRSAFYRSHMQHF